MHSVLLLGAGFSRNWGGWLATECFEYLLGCPQVDPELRDLLWNHRQTDGFEGALADLQKEHFKKKDTRSEQRLRKLQDAIMQMFGDMEKAFARVKFEFQNDLEFLVRSFLVRFDAIFALNQDLLMERYYLDGNVALSSYRRWSGWEIPGMKPVLGIGMGLVDTNTGRWVPDPSAQIIDGNRQPYIKLHGSSNWTDESGKELLVMGGDKLSIIDQFPILKWNHERFKEYLSRPSTRLMVVGYSFGDLHINQTIRDAADVLCTSVRPIYILCTKQEHQGKVIIR